MKIIVFIFFAYLYISIIVFIYTLVSNPQRLNYNERINESKLFCAFLIGAFIALWLVLGVGIEKVSFIPYSWGWHDEEGDWTSARTSIAYFLGVIGAGYIFWLIGELQRKEGVIKELQSRYQKLKGIDSGH